MFILFFLSLATFTGTLFHPGVDIIVQQIIHVNNLTII